MNKLIEAVDMRNMRLMHMSLTMFCFQGFGTFHDKEQSILVPNTRMGAPTKPTQQGKYQWHN